MDVNCFLPKLQNIGNSSAMPFISCRNIHFCQQLIWLSATYFMSGVRPIEMIAQVALSEQAPTGNLYNHFCMAELLHKSTN